MTDLPPAVQRMAEEILLVDRVWTFLPVAYSVYYALLPFWPIAPPFPLFPYAPEGLDRTLVNRLNPRALLMADVRSLLRLTVFAAMLNVLNWTLWMFRLTSNTWHRGLYNLHDEDYRWAILRAKIPKWLFQIFNLTFISMTQNKLLFLLALLTHNVVFIEPAHCGLKLSDDILAVLNIVTLVIEFIAEN